MFPMMSYEFGVEVVKFTDEVSNKVIQEIIIVLRHREYAYPIISPVNCFLTPFRVLKPSSQYQYASKLTGLLNFLYKVKRKQLIDLSHVDVADYLQYLTEQGKSRQNVKSIKEYLVRILYHASYKYPNSISMNCDDFEINGNKYNLRSMHIIHPMIEASCVLPSTSTDIKKKRNKISNLDFEIVIKFLEIAQLETPNCALAFYFMFFGGLRASEVLHLTSYCIPKVVDGCFYINVPNEILNEESMYSDINLSKKPRKQIVFYVQELYDVIYRSWVSRYHSGPIVLNHSNKPMTYSGFRKRFMKVKRILIDSLKNGDINSKEMAFKLENYSWTTHVGRGVFSNNIADKLDNPYLVSVLRGDSSFESALPYIEDSEKMVKVISEGLSNMYRHLIAQTGVNDENNIDY